MQADCDELRQEQSIILCDVHHTMHPNMKSKQYISKTHKWQAPSLSIIIGNHILHNSSKIDELVTRLIYVHTHTHIYIIYPRAKFCH